MLPQEQQKLDKLYQSMVRALKRQGMSDVTVDTYSRAVIRIASHFDRCPDELTRQDLKDYFDHFITIRSWSTVRAAILLEICFKQEVEVGRHCKTASNKTDSRCFDSW